MRTHAGSPMPQRRLLLAGVFVVALASARCSTSDTGSTSIIPPPGQDGGVDAGTGGGGDVDGGVTGPDAGSGGGGAVDAGTGGGGGGAGTRGGGGGGDPGGGGPFPPNPPRALSPTAGSPSPGPRPPP